MPLIDYCSQMLNMSKLIEINLELKVDYNVISSLCIATLLPTVFYLALTLRTAIRM